MSRTLGVEASRMRYSIHAETFILEASWMRYDIHAETFHF
jgi:hypothetical protein